MRGWWGGLLAIPLFLLGLASAPVPGAAAADSTAVSADSTTARPSNANAAAKLVARDSVRARDYVKRLSDPRWDGRGIGTPGLDSAAAWIAARLQAAGLQPAGDSGGWFQPFEVTTGVVAEAPCELRAGGRRFTLGDSLQPLGFTNNGTLRGRVVFAGYGITAPGYEWDDYAGLDVQDAVVLVLTQEPGELDSTSRFDGTLNTPFSDLRMKAINAREHGAIAMLAVQGPRWHAGELPRPPAREGEGYMSGGLLAAWITQEAADAVLKSSGTSLAQAQERIEHHQQPTSFAVPDSVTVTVNVRRSRAMTRNVAGRIPGRDAGRTLVMGAHYDHLGYGGPSSLAPNLRAPHVGADDNASGVTAMITAAERLAQRTKQGWKPAHTLVFAAFSSEEMGLVGSSRFADGPADSLSRVPKTATVEAMLNLDMVGRLRNERMQVMGVGTAAELLALVRATNEAVPAARFDLRTTDDGYGPSDHSSFYKKNVPVLMLFTGAHADYHKPSDTWEKVNAAGVARISRFAQALVESLDVRPKLAFTKARSTASPGRIAGGGGYGAWLGTVPDYMQTEGGVLLGDVRDGSPAQKAGLRGGDVIIRFDGVRVDNIYDYTFALRTRKPGQDVRITVKRGGQETDLVATLGRRP
jgi:hypothetical protein